MNQEVKPLTAILVIAFFIAILGGKFWASGEEKSVRTYSYMQNHPNGNVYIMLGHQLFGFDEQGYSTKTIDLQQLGVDKSIITDFAFFNNGDILLRRAIIEHSLIHDIQRYQRETNQDDLFTDDQKVGLFRCDQISFDCVPFTKNPLNLSDTFALFIDWQTNRVFLSDSTHHTVYLFSEQGEMLSSATDFIFPNQVIYQDNQLYVADTNHHELAILKVSSDKIEEKIEKMDTRTDESKKLSEVWTSSILLLPTQRWVVNSRNNMGNGGIYVFDSQGHFLKQLERPVDSDIFGMLKMGESVLVSDYSKDTIYRYDLNGKRLANFESPVMQSALEEAKTQRKLYQNINLSLNYAFAIFLLIGFMFAIFVQHRNKALSQNKQDELAKPIPTQLTKVPLTANLNDPEIEWLKIKTSYKVFCFFATASILICTIIAILSLMDLPYTVRLPDFVWLLVIIVPFNLLISLRTKLGIKGDDIIFVPAIGKPTQCNKEAVIFSKTNIALGETIVTIMSLHQLFYENDIEEKLLPLVYSGMELTPSQFQNLTLKRPIIIAFLVILAIMLSIVFLKLGLR